MEFNNIKIVKKANVYFGGQVVSRTIYLDTNERKTLGFMQKGEFEFNTEAKEIMEVLGGSMDIMLNGQSEYTTYTENQSFEVEKNSSFKIIVSEYADYCCSYLD